MKVSRRLAPILVLLLAVACASAHRTAILVDQSFAAAVFALDDAEWAVYTACRPEPACEARHVKLNPPIKQALLDVKAVTLAIKATPDGVPTSLPALLTDLLAAEAAIDALPASSAHITLSEKARAALNQAIELLRALTGGA